MPRSAHYKPRSPTSNNIAVFDTTGTVARLRAHCPSRRRFQSFYAPSTELGEHPSRCTDIRSGHNGTDVSTPNCVVENRRR
jgi:hypothetical protein